MRGFFSDSILGSFQLDSLHGDDSIKNHLFRKTYPFDETNRFYYQNGQVLEKGVVFIS